MITVVGSRDGTEVTRFVLAHGEDPAVGLAARGWPGGRGTNPGPRWSCWTMACSTALWLATSTS